MKDIKTKPRRLKVIGGALLLLSFILQNIAYDFWNSQAEEYYKSNKDYSEMSRSSLLYLNLYFNTHLADKNLETIAKAQYINQAAEKAALGQTISVIVRDTDKKGKVDLSNSLLQKAKSVTDFNGYLDYINYSKQIDTYRFEDNWKRIMEINNKKDTCRWAFLFAYIIGSVFLIFGLKYE